MLKLPAGAEYSLLAMLDLAAQYGNGEPVKAANIAEAHGISLSFLERLLAQLRAAGLLVSTRGPGGGHRLSRPPESISAGEVLEVIIGPGGNAGRLGFLWERCEQAVGSVVSVSLADLAAEWRQVAQVTDYQI